MIDTVGERASGFGALSAAALIRVRVDGCNTKPI